jgi:hypothetical protein
MASPPRWPKRFARVAIRAAMMLVLLILTGWAALMLHYSNLPWGWLRAASVVALLVVAGWAIVAILRISPRPWRELAAFGAVWAGLVIWFLLIPSSQTRNWQPDVARPPQIAIDGDRVVIQNVRNFHYRSETDFDEHWETRTYDLARLDGHDLICVYWGSPAIAHTMISFRFRSEQSPGEYEFLPISIEVRKEKGESYSAIAGFFRQYELFYVVADERDVIGLRTNHRNEDVYIYRTQASPERSRRILLDYLKTADELSREPRWYNALTDNCTNGILYHVRSLGDNAPYTWEVMLSGYADRYAYKAGSFGTDLTFDELKQRALVNDAAAGNEQRPDFSTIIRRGVTGYSTRSDSGEPVDTGTPASPR